MGAVIATTILLLFSVAIALPMVHGSIDESPEAVEKWFKKLGHMQEKVTKLHFYKHVILNGNNISTVQVAQPNNITSLSPTFFGAVDVFDDVLTVGPEPDSEVVGRGQGIIVAAGLQEIDFLFAFNFILTTGKYNGSTLSVLGQDPSLHPWVEMPIVGGSGVFRLARGITTTNTYFLNTTNGNAVIEYHVFVLHYS